MAQSSGSGAGGGAGAGGAAQKIHVTASLAQAVCWPGESNACLITLTNRATGDGESLVFDGLSVFAVGVLKYHRSWIESKRLPKTVADETVDPALLGENARCLFCTQPSELLRGTTFAPGDTRSVRFSCTLPEWAPPSHRGTVVRFVYQFVVSISRDGQEPVLIRMPFRVLPMVVQVPKGAGALRGELVPMQAAEVVTPEAGSLMHGRQPCLHEISSRRQIDRARPMFFNISQGAHTIARCALVKDVFTLGGTITGTFDFSKATLPCYQVSVTLLSNEVFGSTYVNPSRQKIPVQTAVAEQHELSVNTATTSFTFFIPPAATPSFQSEYINLEWILRVEFFVVNVAAESVTGAIPGAALTFPTNGNSEAIKWELPIRVLADRTMVEAVAHNQPVERG